MLTADAKRLLAETIRGTAQTPENGTRARLLRAIHDEADRQYRLSVPIAEAGLDEAHQRQRARIEAWLDERARATKPKNNTEWRATTERVLAQAEKEAAATLVSRLALLRQAHHCFWELHPATAYTWELLLQDEIRPDFTIDEPGSGEARAKFLPEHATVAREILARELKRRERKLAKADDQGDAGDSDQLFDDPDERNEAAADA